MTSLLRAVALPLMVWGLTCLGTSSAAAETEASWRVEQRDGRLVIALGQQSACEYVFADEKLPRPYFCQVHAPGSVAVTRTHPPVAGRDPVDHADMHPGVWLAFGDLNGADFWRNKGQVKHVRFVEPPTIDDETLTFVVENQYRSGDGANGKVLATEVCRHRLVRRDGGYWITFDSSLSGAETLAFGDQEEMGLGVRLASPLRVAGGSGEIVDAEARRNEQQVWGKQATWCDYSGEVEGQRAGLLVAAHAGNFRPSWFHVRDYGLLVANPFGRKAFTGGEPSRVEVAPGDKLRLRFGVWVHGGPASEKPDLAAAYGDYLRLAGEEK